VLTLEAAFRIAGRILLGGLFVAGGIHHYFAYPRLVRLMTARRVFAPALTLVTGSLFQIVVGVLVMVGLWPKSAALGLVLFVIVASIMLLDFWNMSGEAREAAMTAWQSNLAIVGGLLLVAAG
jgi:putative oxidoreductase